MLLKRIYHESLAQAAYLVGCQRTGEALVVDPLRDPERYLEAARADGLRITQVTETHVHADFVSGARELAVRAGARLLLSAEGDARWGYRYASDAGAEPLRDGARWDLGEISVEALHTPGHTPEHLTFLMTDRAASERPMGAFTGDFIFVGDVGRPDLLERAAGAEGTMTGAARALFRSLRRTDALPDWLQIWPGHGAGSACGKSLGAVPQTTLGYERIASWAFAERDEQRFVDAVLAGQPDPPRYFAEMKRVNVDGPTPLGQLSTPATLRGPALVRQLAQGAFVIDTRSASDFAAAHLPRTINIPFEKSILKWMGWLAPYDRDLVLLAPDAPAAQSIVHELRLIGLDRVTGVGDRSALDAWRAAGHALGQTPQVGEQRPHPSGVANGTLVVDVRAPDEWAAGHIPGALNIPLGHLAERAGELPRDRPIAVNCQGGGRSSIAASVLRANGFEQVANLAGGFRWWERSGFPVSRASRVEES
jgi:hydroxyacylglutathione hydrolase